MDINSSYHIALYDRFSNENRNPKIQSSSLAKVLYQKYQESKTKQSSQSTVSASDMNLDRAIFLSKPFSPREIKNKGTAGLKLFDASALPAAPTNDADFTAWCAQQLAPNGSPLVLMPTSFGDFGGNRGDVSKLQPVNFNQLDAGGLHSSATQSDYVAAGIIDQDYVTQFNAILKDSKGNLRSGDTVLEDALNKYSEIRNNILSGNSSDSDLKIQQLENSLSWAVGTSLNRFGFDMTQSNAMFVKAPEYSDAYRAYSIMYGNGSIAKADVFSYDNSSYITAANIVFSAAKLVEKGIDYVNSNQYDPKNSAHVSNLLSAMNSGTNDKDSSNLSLPTLNDVISTFRRFENATNNYILSNAGKAAQNAPTDDIASVYTNMRFLIENDRLGAHVDEEF